MKGKIKISQMHFALRSTCFISMVYRAVCLQAKPSWYHMATAVIIWMLWCTSMTTVPRECAQSLNAPSRWHLKRTVWIWIFDCALHLQIVGFGSRKVSSDCRANHSQYLNQGERNEMQKKSTSAFVSGYIYEASVSAVHLSLLFWCRQNMSDPQMTCMPAWSNICYECM